MSLHRIPPMSAEETLKFYADGTIPARFSRYNADYKRQSVLSCYGAPKPLTDQDDDDGQTLQHNGLNDYM